MSTSLYDSGLAEQADPHDTGSVPASTITDETRFAFGKNWSKFLDLLDDERMRMARESLQSRLGLESLEGKTFVDCGSGSGLFSLAAAQLGAKQIFGFGRERNLAMLDMKTVTGWGCNEFVFRACLDEAVVENVEVG